MRRRRAIKAGLSAAGGMNIGCARPGAFRAEPQTPVLEARHQQIASSHRPFKNRLDKGHRARLTLRDSRHF